MTSAGPCRCPEWGCLVGRISLSKIEPHKDELLVQIAVDAGLGERCEPVAATVELDLRVLNGSDAIICVPAFVIIITEAEDFAGDQQPQGAHVGGDRKPRAVEHSHA